jgi:PKD repeat protein
VFSHNVWSKQPSPADFYNAATDKLGNAGLSNPPAILKTPADMRPKDYELVRSSVAIDAATKAYNAASGVDVTVDHFGNTRDNKPDIGMHEFQKVTTQANFSASPLQGVSPLKVTFQDQSVSPDPITNWLWDFGDGSISNLQNPSHIYNAGTFTVSLRAANSLGSNIITKSNLITAEAITPDATPRVKEGLQALYRFDQRNGNSIYDVSGEGAPLDLVINDLSRVKWTNDGLTILQPTLIASNGPAEKINEACRISNEVTIEVWCTPANKTQEGPARIVSLSQNVHSRNLTLGQGLWGSQPSDLFDIRLRTTERSANGMPSFSSPQGSAAVAKTHIVFARNRRGLVRLYVNGVVVAESNIPGDFSTWNPRFPLLLGNETTGEYPWLGQLFLVAVYDRFLSWEEAKQNYRAGTHSPATQESNTIGLTSFKRFVLVSQGENKVIQKAEATAVAYGVQYPDERCVVCTINGTNRLTIYNSINKVLSTYASPGVNLQWLD